MLINKINRILFLKTFSAFLVRKKYHAFVPLKYRLGFNCEPGLFTMELILLRKMLHKPTFLAATGKGRCCLLNVMVQFGSFSPDKIWQTDDLTRFYIENKIRFFLVVSPKPSFGNCRFAYHPVLKHLQQNVILSSFCMPKVFKGAKKKSVDK